MVGPVLVRVGPAGRGFALSDDTAIGMAVTNLLALAAVEPDDLEVLESDLAEIHSGPNELDEALEKAELLTIRL
jgi:hypothetical protein